jgi:esterase/lipase
MVKNLTYFISIFVLNSCISAYVSHSMMFEPQTEYDFDSLWVSMVYKDREQRTDILYRNVSADSPTVVIFHGAGETHRSYSNKTLIDYYVDNGINVAIPEYAQYGLSRGSLNIDSVTKCISESLIKLNIIKEISNNDNKKVIFDGFSVGSVIAVKLSRNIRCDILVLRSMLPQIKELTRFNKKQKISWIIRPLVKISIDPTLSLNECSLLSSIDSDVIIHHGNFDKTSSCKDVINLYENCFNAASSKRLFVSKSSHNGLLNSPDLDSVQNYLSKKIFEKK